MTRERVAEIVSEVFGTVEVQTHEILSDTLLWKYVFERVFGSPPESDDDPRWNTLLLPQEYGALGACVHVIQPRAQ